MNLNQGIAVAAVISGILAVFFGPRFYYDYKISECASAQVNEAGGNEDFRHAAEAYCHRYINGVR